MKNFTVDRIEGDFIVVTDNDGNKTNLPQSFLPELNEGDSFSVTVTDNSDKKDELKARLNKLFERGNENDK
ncbi:MAG: DUF3006 domain-containing protein [Clostridia bacterium]|nr:DUF3006 domain-containing protein [Clostridia bacterium]